MSNVLTAKNSFQDGLLMDFAPENTGAGNLTNALNATLVTFNGNEMVLLNDMGNGRVETARLPEGFIPVGTCEFGDIIYIVSYNPITDKSQIGCFPSPERNISSDEISNSELSISINDFLELTNRLVLIEEGSKRYIKTDDDLENYSGDYKSENGDIITLPKDLNIQLNESFTYLEKAYILNKDEELYPTGKLKKTSVKKVIVETKKLNPGDKYILYTDKDSAIINNKEFLSGYGTGSIESNPKSLKLHVVSIEDSGKITYLDTTTKWYDVDKNDESYSDYLINYQQKVEGGERIDLDSYRDLLESNWSIFSSKVSGKLAILAELETIDTFSCSYDVELISTDKESDDKGIIYNYYKLYLYPEYTSKHKDIKPAYIVATKSTFAKSLVEGKDTASLVLEGENGEKKFISNSNSGWELTSDGKIDTGITFRIPYTKTVQSDDKQDVSIKIKSEALIYTMLITPAMDYGMLDYLAQEIIIDFNKIGTGEINLTTWKYHNSETTSILTFGFESYPKPNHEIKAIVMDFYDAQGLCAEYVMSDKKSYNGVFTEYILLEQNTGNFRFSNDKINLQTLKSLLSEFNDKYKYISLVDQIEKLGLEIKNTPNGSEHTALLHKYTDLTNKLAILTSKISKDYDNTSDNYIEDLNTILENYNYSERISEDTAQNEKIVATFNDNFKFEFSNEKFKEPIEHYTNVVYELNPADETKFKWVLPKEEEGISDVNTIYPNNLYKVVIKVCSAREDNKSNLEVTEFKRWYWTTSMFNNYYYTCNDFQILQFQLELDANVLYFSKPNFVWKEESLNNLNTDKFTESSEFNPEDDSQNTFSANVAYIGEKDESNLGMSIQAGLANDYGCFNLNKSDLSNIKVDIYLGGGNISYDDTEYSWSVEPQEINLQTFIEKKNLEIDAGTDPGNIDSLSIKDKQGGLNDRYNLKFAIKDLDLGNFKFTDNTTSNDSEEYKHYLLTTDLNSCYYASNSDYLTIKLIFKAKLYNKSYVADLLSSKINVPVYKPIISNIQDLNNLGIENIDYTMDKNFGSINKGDKVTRLYFESGITLGSLWSIKGVADSLISSSGITFRGPDYDSPYSDAFSPDVDDDYNYKFVTYDVNSSQITDILKNTLKKRKTFFLLYPGSGTTDTANQNYGHKIPSMLTTKWRNLYWKDPELKDSGSVLKEPQSYITKTNIDPTGTSFTVNAYGLTPFLAVKVNEETCYMLNSAYASSINGNAIRQASVYAHEDSSGKAEEWNTPFYDNFAQLLYLLLTHTYHANCTKTSSESILTSNIISNNPFEATLTRDIVVSLSDNSEDHDIVFKNQSFNHYVRVLQSNINPEKDGSWINLKAQPTDKNIILKYIEKGVLSLLTVSKKVKPLTNSASISAYYYYGGKLNALSEELQSDTFFVLQNGELSMYKDDRELVFDADSYKLLFDHPMTVIPYKLKFSTSEGFNNYINLVFTRLDDIILKSNNQNNTISIPIDRKNGDLHTDINNELKKQSVKNNTLYNILAGAAWIDSTDPTYQKLFRLKTTKCTNRPLFLNIMGDELIPEFNDNMVTKLYQMLNFEFQPYPLAFPRLKAELKSDETPNKLIITEFMGCQLTTPIEIPISDDIITRVPSDFESIPIKKEVEDIYGRILTITFGHSEFMKTEDGSLYLPSLKLTFEGKNYEIKEPKIIKPEPKENLYNIEVTESVILENTWGNLIITKSAIQPEYKVAYYDALGFKCGLGLNRAFTYNNKLEPIANMGGSFGFFCKNDTTNANTINIGSANLYIDSHFKLDYPELPNWSGVRNITNIENNEN